MDAATIEETNRIRVSLGMKPLPVPGAAPADSQRDTSASDDEDAPSTLESRQAQAYDNYKKVRDAEAAKRKREERAAAAKKERDNAQRLATLEGKGLGDVDESGDLDAKAWLKSQKKRQKAIEKARKLEEEQAAAEAAALAAVEYTSKDLAGVKVAHELDNFLDGDEQILTLKDATIEENEEEGDELENMDLRAREKLQETLDLKKKKPAYDVHATDEDGQRGILSQYDEEIYGKKGKKFTLDGSGAIAELSDILGAPAVKSKKLQNISLDDVIENTPTSDYIDISEIKVKKPKKKKSKSTRQKPVDEDDIFPIDAALANDDQMDVDSGAAVSKKRKVEDDTFVDDEDLQASLAIQRRNALKKRKKTRPEDIARQLKEQANEPENEAPIGGVVIDEISEFVSGLKKPDEEEERKPRKPKAVEESVTAMDAESDQDEDHPMDDAYREESADRAREASADIAATGVDEEKTISTGMGSLVSLLRERGILKDAHGAELNMSERQKAEFLAEKKRIEREQEERAKSQRERDRNSGRLDAMSVRDREERARQANAHRELQQSRVVDDLFKKHYKPNVELRYTDEHGRSLDQKEAFKHMSHQFHGKGSGKGKTDKRLKKIEEEKRREAQSVLDSSENANMSSSAAKRREAGVRLQ